MVVISQGREEERLMKLQMWLISRFMLQVISVIWANILPNLWMASLCYPVWAVRLIVLCSSSSFRTRYLAECSLLSPEKKSKS